MEEWAYFTFTRPRILHFLTEAIAWKCCSMKKTNPPSPAQWELSKVLACFSHLVNTALIPVVTVALFSHSGILNVAHVRSDMSEEDKSPFSVCRLHMWPRTQTFQRSCLHVRWNFSSSDVLLFILTKAQGKDWDSFLPCKSVDDSRLHNNWRGLKLTVIPLNITVSMMTIPWPPVTISYVQQLLAEGSWEL